MRLPSLLLLALAAIFVPPASARAAPPVNDNRAAAQVITGFPSTIPGTTVEATVENLDPQVSGCGSVEATVWYRINQAPDGTIALAVKGAGLAPVVRVYSQLPSSIQELTCGSAAAGGEATAAFRTKRGNSYLILVGRKPGTADAAVHAHGEAVPAARERHPRPGKAHRAPARTGVGHDGRRHERRRRSRPLRVRRRRHRLVRTAENLVATAAP